MEEGSDLGLFELLPRDLRIWFFARLLPDVLPKLRRNQELKKFIDEAVYPYIEGKLTLTLEVNKEYQRETKGLSCTECKCKCQRVGGAIKIPILSFGLDPRNYQPSGSVNFSRIDNYTFKIWPEEHQPSSGTIGWAPLEFETGFVRLGVCYRCVLVNGLPSKPK